MSLKMISIILLLFFVFLLFFFSWIAGLQNDSLMTCYEGETWTKQCLEDKQFYIHYIDPIYDFVRYSLIGSFFVLVVHFGYSVIILNRIKGYFLFLLIFLLILTTLFIFSYLLSLSLGSASMIG